MTETMLVRAAGGSWEELHQQTTLPEGGVLDVFGEDIGPVLGTTSPIIVVACQPTLSTGAPDALCVDADGAIWIVQLDLDGTGDALLPQLLAFGGALTGMAYDAFETACDQRGSDSLAEYVELRSSSGFHAPTFEVGITESLRAGRLRLVAIVRESSPALVQSMRFINATGATGLVYEASSFASASVSAIRARAVDVGAGAAADHGAEQQSAPAARPARAGTTSTKSNDRSRDTSSDAPASAAAFLAATGRETDTSTATLIEQLVTACDSCFDELRFDGDGAASQVHAILHGADGDAELITAGSDGSVAISFEALGALDPSWSIRAELCQGMERLLGADLGEVRKISQLNLTIAEHLMDATLMDAMLDLVRDTVEGVSSSRVARTPAAA